MKYLLYISIFSLILISNTSLTFQNENSAILSIAPIQNIFMQGNNINTVFRTDGIMNYDWVTFPSMDAGMIWPVSSATRKTINYTSGLWVGAKVMLSGNQKELRLAAAMYQSHYTPGNIPVVGGIPPQSVCDDPIWRGYYVCLTDPTLVNGGTRTKVAGGRTYTFNYDPWSLWPVNLGAPYVEVNNITGYQPGWNADRPGIGNSDARPDELLFMVYMDYTNCTNNIHDSEISLPGGTLPIGVEIHQLTFMFNCAPLKDMYFIKCKIINKSSKQWDSTYIGYADEIDIGGGPQGAGDDARGCDTLRDIGYMYNADNDDFNYGPNPPALGYRILQGPLKYTGNQNDTAKLPYDTLVGYKVLGLGAFSSFIAGPPDTCLFDPDNATEGYNFMRGMDGCGRVKINPITGQPTAFEYTGDACNRVGWFDSSSDDSRFLMSTGPFTMNSLDTQVIVLGAVIGHGGNNFLNVCLMLFMSDLAKAYYYSGFCNSLIGIKKESESIPSRYALYQNYPNPFNPVTKIRFDIPVAPLTFGEGLGVRLVVYDILGREVVTLVNEQLKPGSYEVDWDGTEFSSGLYLYRLESDNPSASSGRVYTQTRKMLLLK